MHGVYTVPRSLERNARRYFSPSTPLAVSLCCNKVYTQEEAAVNGRYDKITINMMSDFILSCMITLEKNKFQSAWLRRKGQTVKKLKTDLTGRKGVGRGTQEGFPASLKSKLFRTL